MVGLGKESSQVQCFSTTLHRMTGSVVFATTTLHRRASRWKKHVVQDDTPPRDIDGYRSKRIIPAALKYVKGLNQVCEEK